MEQQQDLERPKPIHPSRCEFTFGELGCISGSVIITEPKRREIVNRKAKVVEMGAVKQKPGALF
jgi:hypothetical protein